MGASEPPNFSWVVEGRLAGLAMPREPGHYRYLRERGVRHLVSLTERAPPHHGCCPQIQLHRLRVADFTPPSPEQIQSFLRIVEEANGRGEHWRGELRTWMAPMELGTPECQACPAPSVPSCIKGLACGFSPHLVLGYTLGGCLVMALLGTPRPSLVGSCILGFGVLALGSCVWGSSGFWFWIPALSSLRALNLGSFRIPILGLFGILALESLGVMALASWVWGPSGFWIPALSSLRALVLGSFRVLVVGLFRILALGSLGSQILAPASGFWLWSPSSVSWLRGLSESWFQYLESGVSLGVPALGSLWVLALGSQLWVLALGSFGVLILGSHRVLVLGSSGVPNLGPGSEFWLWSPGFGVLVLGSLRVLFVGSHGIPALGWFCPWGRSVPGVLEGPRAAPPEHPRAVTRQRPDATWRVTTVSAPGGRPGTLTLKV
ncbi:dual specificity protein phosphatase 23 isoform X1 [Passer domesticus]|uniref:dual specificity protein phosphatase 23 isoform X1 n=1 Tax=Passer domesticus TaxID=48849 RepID=UPI0030FEDAA9